MSGGKPTEARPGLGTQHRIDEQTILVLGQELVIAQEQPDVGNAVVHRCGDTVFLIDSGVTTPFRDALAAALDEVGAWKHVVLLTTHGHLDHVGNNHIVEQLALRRGCTTEHFVPARDLAQLTNPQRYWAHAFEQIQAVTQLPGPPDLMAHIVTTWFHPYRPITPVTRVYESMPLRRLDIGLPGAVGWIFANGAIQVMASQGHCAGHVIVHLREPGVLHVGDELNGPCAPMPDADQLKISTTWNAVESLLETADIDVVTDGHSMAPLSREHAVHRLNTYRDLHLELHNRTRQLMDDQVTEPNLAAVVSRYTDILTELGISGPNDNPLFTAMKAVQSLISAGLNPEDQPGLWKQLRSHSRPARPTTAEPHEPST
jgi:glyoxylase-like metal-dependent hydrolase (beta-lactamase superfamily II)